MTDLHMSTRAVTPKFPSLNAMDDTSTELDAIVGAIGLLAEYLSDLPNAVTDFANTTYAAYAAYAVAYLVEEIEGKRDALHGEIADAGDRDNERASRERRPRQARRR